MSVIKPPPDDRGEPMHRVDAYRMIWHRAAQAGFKQKLGCQIFRGTGITAYLVASGTRENAQAIAVHESPHATELYDVPATRLRSTKLSGNRNSANDLGSR